MESASPNKNLRSVLETWVSDPSKAMGTVLVALATVLIIVMGIGFAGQWRAEDNAEDFVGDNDGTLENGATFAFGKVSKAFSLDGVDDYVSFTLTDGPTGDAAHTCVSSAHLGQLMGN